MPRADRGFVEIAVSTATRPRVDRPELIAPAVAGTLPDRPDLDGSCGLGFLIVHDDADLLHRTLLHWWVRPDLLHQRVFGVDPAAPGSVAPVAAAPIGGPCDLAIIEHEGGAWQRHVCGNAAGPDLDAYVTDVLHPPDRSMIPAG